MKGRDDDSRRVIGQKLTTLLGEQASKSKSELAKLVTLAKALRRKDPYTQAHSHRVEAYSAVIAGELGVGGQELETIRQAAALHDIGKIGVPDEILTKPDRLTEEEMHIIREHPRIALKMLKDLLYSRECVTSVYHHHEWFNGEGYPARRAGEKIPLGSRVIAVADAYDAMTSDRPYRKATSVKQAERELLYCSGSQFDPEVVKAFCSAKKKGKMKPD
ncbi:MAG: HD-GYP domain-containing protein [Chloroflexi bacterium]|nr:HD-GYP domain-containing protein [Chloroflexota bacterium]